MFNLKHIFGFVTLTAFWSLAYAIDSAWIGTAIVVATASFYAWINYDAARNQQTAQLIFAIAGMSWMVFCLGFIAETPKNVQAWNLPKKLFEIAHFGNPPDYNSVAFDQIVTDRTIHSLHVSGTAARIKGVRVVPGETTAIRLAVCVSSILIASLFTPFAWLFPKLRIKG